MTEPILVTGTLAFDPANHDAVVAAMTAMMATTRAEAGNLAYTFSADLAEPGRFHLLEQWVSQDAIDEHMAAPHMAEFLTAMGSLGATEASISQWNGATRTTLM